MITIDAPIGSDIKDTINRARVKAWWESDTVQFDFNGVTVYVKGDSDEELIYRDWSRAMAGQITGTVGPYPKAKLTRAEKANDARIEAENAARRAAKTAEYKARQAVKAATTDALLDAAPPIELSDEAAYQDWKANNTDPYGAGIFRYAENWARLMQVRIAAGDALEDIADETSHAADTEGITGFMHGAAVSILSKCWVHGDQLRKWHNRSYGVSDDVEGTVNPAVITVTPKD